MLRKCLYTFIEQDTKLYCYGTNTVSVKIIREMVLLPNDEEVVSSKKTYPIQDYSAQTTISDQNGQN